MRLLVISIVLAFAATAAGCGSTPLEKQKEIVTVDKPVPYIPKPPAVPAFVSQVDKLTLDDAKDPGKVGQAYKYDMYELRALLKIYQAILDQYRAGSQNFDAVNEQIQQLYKAIPPKQN